MSKNDIFEFHKKFKGKINITLSNLINNKSDLSLAYTPGVAEISREIYKDKENAYKYTIKPHTVAIVSDGSAVLGLGNIGAMAAIPVMEGKAALFKKFANIDAFPICVNTQEPKEIIELVKNISPVFGGVNLEDIKAPQCFEVEDALQDLGIPVMHDDQHGTAVVVLAGLLNASKVVKRQLSDLNVVINGAGAAGNAITKLLSGIVKNIIVCDSKGIVSKKRKDLDPYKNKLLKITNKNNVSGELSDALINSDVFIGVSKGNLLAEKHIKLMNKNPIIFALANPIPEIMPQIALKAGTKIVATGRSDFKNQINNSLAFPGIFKGALEVRATKITKEMKIAASYALSKLVKKPTTEKIIPEPFDKGIAEAVSKAVKKAYKNQIE